MTYRVNRETLYPIGRRKVVEGFRFIYTYTSAVDAVTAGARKLGLRLSEALTCLSENNTNASTNWDGAKGFS